MRQIFCLLLITLVISSCEKNNTDDNTPGNSIYGRYTGTFYRTGMDTAEVQVALLSDNRFEGSSEQSFYPAICSGDFTFANDYLSVNDTCTWTANFDWTLIFDGNYNVSFTGNNTVRIWRTSGAVTDEYLLKKTGTVVIAGSSCVFVQHIQVCSNLSFSVKVLSKTNPFFSNTFCDKTFSGKVMATIFVSASLSNTYGIPSFTDSDA
ncbi:MAG: hypothetical protein WDO71_08680 [Bacteroidota bacterium]